MKTTKETFYTEYINEVCSDILLGNPRTDILPGSPVRTLVNYMALMAWEIYELKEKK